MSLVLLVARYGDLSVSTRKKRLSYNTLEIKTLQQSKNGWMHTLCISFDENVLSDRLLTKLSVL